MDQANSNSIVVCLLSLALRLFARIAAAPFKLRLEIEVGAGGQNSPLRARRYVRANYV
jgi:hypothetical protein